MKIVVSTTCFEYWNIGASEILETIGLSDLRIDGIEFTVPQRWMPTIKDYAVLAQYPSNILKAPQITLRNNKEAYKFVKRLWEFYDKLPNISHVVFSPEVFPDLSVLDEFDFPYLFENQDEKARRYNNLADLHMALQDDGFARRGLALNINHINRIFPADLPTYIKTFGTKIRQICLSALGNDLYREHDRNIHTNSYLCSLAGYLPNVEIPMGSSIVLRGIVPRERIDMMVNEVNYVKQACTF